MTVISIPARDAGTLLAACRTMRDAYPALDDAVDPGPDAWRASLDRCETVLVRALSRGCAFDELRQAIRDAGPIYDDARAFALVDELERRESE